ncbi:MAG: hypothetical protein NC834_00010 [Candidatus Omnitrophica bacterium]|nr:hypothetical protein [Candidatus Omnitrophota bacterium]
MADFREEGIVLSVQGKIARVKITLKGSCPDDRVGCPVNAFAEGREFITEIENTINAHFFLWQYLAKILIPNIE